MASLPILALCLATLLALACSRHAPMGLTPAGCQMHGALPDPACTPGALNPAVTQATITETICKPGWTAAVRPSSSYTRALKREQMRQYRLRGRASDYTEDHLVPLGVGGAPADPRNLWPEPSAAALAKDRLELRVRAAVCSGRMSLAEGQAVFLEHGWEAK